MQQREFSVQSVQEVAAKVDGARYLLVSPDLYREALKMTVLRTRVELCAMVLYSTTGKVWGVASDVDHHIEVASLEDVERVVTMFDAESEEEKAARVASSVKDTHCFIYVGPPQYQDAVKTVKRYFKPMSESGMEAVEEFGMEVAA